MNGDEPTIALARPVQRDDGSLRVLFVCGADFRSPTEKVVLGYALGLVELGHQVLIAIRGETGSIDSELGGPCPDALMILAYRFLGPKPRRRDRRQVTRFRPDVVHVFNPRFDVVQAVRGLNDEVGAPIVVHFEDDEWGLARGSGEGALPRRAGRWVASKLAPVYPPAWRLATPGTLAWAGRVATELEAITPELASHVSSELDRECAVLLPVHPAAGSAAPAAEPPLPPWLGRRDTVVFTGAVFSAHAADFRLLVEAVGELKRRGRDAVLVHAGISASRFDLGEWARRVGLGERDFIELGYLDSSELQGLLQRATVLAQPGAPTEFNRLRLPSKLQAYLASGTPTVTFACGAGELFEDRREVLKTFGDTPGELADRIDELLTDPSLRAELGRNGPRAAGRLFDRRRNCRVLTEIYREAIEEPVQSALDADPR